MTLHPVVKRGTASLAVSFALAWAVTSMLAAPGPATLVALTGSISAAGVYFGVFALASAAGAALGGRAMGRWGRRRVLASAHAVMAAGYAVAGAAVAFASLAGFLVGLVVLALGMGTIYLTRVAAADLYPPALRGRGVARVQFAALAGAVVGPLLLVLVGSTGAFVWFVAPPLALLAAVAVLLGPEPTVVARDLGKYFPAVPAAEAVSGPAAIRRPDVLAAVLTLVLAQAAMIAVMGVTGAALRHEGHGDGAAGATMALHFAGMFGPSLLAGFLADRFGRRPVMLLGLGTLAAGGATVALVPGVAGLAGGLLVVGVGWSLAYVSASVLLADAVPLARRAQVTGFADFAASLFGAAVTFAAGWWYAARGLGGLGVLAVALAFVPVAVVLFTARRARAAPTPEVEAPVPGRP